MLGKKKRYCVLHFYGFLKKKILKCKLGSELKLLRLKSDKRNLLT